MGRYACSCNAPCGVRREKGEDWHVPRSTLPTDITKKEKQKQIRKPQYIMYLFLKEDFLYPHLECKPK